MVVDERTWDVMSSFQRFVDEALEVVRAGAQGSGPLLGEVVERHLGVDPATVQTNIVMLSTTATGWTPADLVAAARARPAATALL